MKADNLILQTLRNGTKPTPRVIWNPSEAPNCKIVSGRITDKQLYKDVSSVRQLTDPRWPDQRTKEDAYSDHYCAYVDGLPVGSLGVTRAIEGDMFLQQFCPSQLVDEFHDLLVSAYRFRILDAYRQTSPRVPGISLSRHMVREAWREQIAKGAGLDIINIEDTHVRLYQRMGYILCDGYEYIDPEIGTPSCIMFLPIDPTHKSFISDLAQEAAITVSIDEVLRCLTRTRVYVNAR